MTCQRPGREWKASRATIFGLCTQMAGAQSAERLWVAVSRLYRAINTASRKPDEVDVSHPTLLAFQVSFPVTTMYHVLVSFLFYLSL